jgi:hypothetical protein
MSGLVVKKVGRCCQPSADRSDVSQAYILGQNNYTFEEITQSTSAILFLSTPHRGAAVVGRALKLLIPGRSSQDYVTALKKNSSTLEDINEQFRNLAPRLEIVSFYEMVATVFGPHEKVGYPDPFESCDKPKMNKPR